MTEFVPVGKPGDVPPGELVLFDVRGRQVAIAMVDGTFYAFDDECTHRGCSLADGELDGTAVVCPCHAGEFDVGTGEVRSGPPPGPVATYPIRVAGGTLEIGM